MSTRVRIGTPHTWWLRAMGTAFCLCLLSGSIGGFRDVLGESTPGSVFMAATAILPIHLLAFIWRSASWLDGSVLTVRSAWTTRTVDLATAEVHGGLREGRGSFYVLLVAIDPAGRVRAELNLGNADRLDFHARDLWALADAIDSAGRTTEVSDRLRRYCRQLPFSRARYLWADPSPLPREISPRG